MGTRHLTCVVKDGEFKVAQYGQWDGYPTGQGKTIVEFLQGRFNKEMFLKKLAKVDWITEDIMKRYWKEAGAKGDTHWVGMDVSDRFKQLHPELHRDTGAKVLEIIQMGKVKYLDNEINFANDSLFCEWCYVLDLDNDVLEVYGGFNKTPLDKGERFYKEKPNEDGYYPVRLLGKYDITNQTELTTLYDLEKGDEDEEN